MTPIRLEASLHHVFCRHAPLNYGPRFAPLGRGWHKHAVRILYHLPLSPYSRKVRLALAEKRIPFDLRVERVWERRAEFLTINPACTVPVLQEENGFCIIDSYAICEYLDEAYPDMPLLGRSLGERAEIRRLVAWFDGKFHFEVGRNLLFEKQMKQLCQFAPASRLPRLACGNPALARGECAVTRGFGGGGASFGAGLPGRCGLGAE